MKQEPLFTTILAIGDDTREVKVHGDLDKATGHTYYTFCFGEDDTVMISKFDGKEWKVANAMQAEKFIANLLGKLIDAYEG